MRSKDAQRAVSSTFTLTFNHEHTEDQDILQSTNQPATQNLTAGGCKPEQRLVKQLCLQGV